MTRSFFFAIPGDINSLTGGYAYDRQIISGLRELGWSVEVLGLGGDYPHPSPETLIETRRLFSQLPPSSCVVIDGLSAGAIPDILAEVSQKHTVVVLLHHPLCMETGLTLAQQAHLRQTETESLQLAQHVIVTSASTAKLLGEFHVLSQKITVIPPGISILLDNPSAPIEGSPKVPERLQSQRGVELLCVGSLIPRKAQDVLILALSALKELSWNLTLVGDTSLNPAFVDQVHRTLKDTQLHDRVHLLGAVAFEQLHKFYREADIFVLPSLYEGYGMAFAEALQHGLPVIGFEGEAVSQTVPSSAGILVPLGNLNALTEALRALITNSELRARYAQGAKEAALQLKPWSVSCALFSEALERTLGQV